MWVIFTWIVGSSISSFTAPVWYPYDIPIYQQTNNVISAVIYRPPGTDLKAFIDAVNELLNALKKENKTLYLIGDYNIKLLNYGKQSETNDFD